MWSGTKGSNQSRLAAALIGSALFVGAALPAAAALSDQDRLLVDRAFAGNESAGGVVLAHIATLEPSDAAALVLYIVDRHLAADAGRRREAISVLGEVFARYPNLITPDVIAVVTNDRTVAGNPDNGIPVRAGLACAVNTPLVVWGTTLERDLLLTSISRLYASVVEADRMLTPEMVPTPTDDSCFNPTLADLRKRLDDVLSFASGLYRDSFEAYMRLNSLPENNAEVSRLVAQFSLYDLYFPISLYADNARFYLGQLYLKLATLSEPRFEEAANFGPIIQAFGANAVDAAAREAVRIYLEQSREAFEFFVETPTGRDSGYRWDAVYYLGIVEALLGESVRAQSLMNSIIDGASANAYIYVYYILYSADPTDLINRRIHATALATETLSFMDGLPRFWFDNAAGLASVARNVP